MRSRFISVVTASLAALAVAVALPTPAQAAEASCFDSATVSAGVPDLLTGSIIGNPVTLNPPLIGAPELFTGPSCEVAGSSAGPLEAKLTVTSTAGLVAGQMVITTSSMAGSFQSKLTCGPSYLSCQASVPVFGAGGTASASARCSVSGVVAALTTVSCSLKPTTF